MPKDRRERIRERAKSLREEMALQELRQALHLTQQQLAETLEINQAAVSKIERESDMFVSTLKRFLAAMGGELRIVASFPGREIVINQFSEIDTPEEEVPG